MEFGQDIYLSTITTEDWEPDDDPPGDVHVLVATDGLEAGFWRRSPSLTPDPVTWTVPTREVILVLRGSARIEMKGGPTLDPHEGSTASLPGGTMTTWHLSPDFMEFWVLAGE